MEFEYFKDLTRNIDEDYDQVSASYIIDNSIFYIEPNFYTQLKYLETQYKGEIFDKLIESIKNIALRNKKVIFTGNFENPLIKKDDYIYREINDVLAENRLILDIKINPDSDWKD